MLEEDEEDDDILRAPAFLLDGRLEGVFDLAIKEGSLYWVCWKGRRRGRGAAARQWLSLL